MDVDKLQLIMYTFYDLCEENELLASRQKVEKKIKDLFAWSQVSITVYDPSLLLAHFHLETHHDTLSLESRRCQQRYGQTILNGSSVITKTITHFVNFLEYIWLSSLENFYPQEIQTLTWNLVMKICSSGFLFLSFSIGIKIQTDLLSETTEKWIRQPDGSLVSRPPRYEPVLLSPRNQSSPTTFQRCMYFDSKAIHVQLLADFLMRMF